MNRKEIILQLGNGSLKGGFPTVNVELKGDDFDGWKRVASLPPNTELESAYKEWLNRYQTSRRLEISRGKPTFHPGTGGNVSVEDTHTATQTLITALNRWLNQGSLADIKFELGKSLQVEDRISLSIITDDEFLWKLPWHQWDFITSYKYCVESFSKSSVQSNRHRKLRANGRIDILPILGDAPELDLDRDLAALKQSRARVANACKPTSALDISNELSRQKQIRIVFFGGHGKTIELELEGKIDSVGKIYLNQNTSISISKIKADLSAAVDRGLQIAIFNCCNGMGLALGLADLNIPYLIVMRYQIPDKLAQQFCSDLLGKYSQGGDFTAAFHYARCRLVPRTDRDDEFESWLPMLVYNPESERFTWADLSRSWWQVPAPQSVVKARKWLTKSERLPLTWIGISLISTGITFGVQTLAPVQKLESKVVDRFQSTQVAMNQTKSRVVVVDLNDRDKVVDAGRVVLNGNSISSGSQLQELTNIPDLTLGVDLQVGTISESLLDNPKIIINCDERPPMKTYSSPIDRNCLALAWAVTKASVPIDRTSSRSVSKGESINKSFVLNPHLIPKIEQIKLSDLSKLKQNNPDIFKGKIVLVGFVKDRQRNLSLQDSSSIILHAIATEQILRSISDHQPLLTSSTDSIGTIYILFWAGLSGSSIFYARRLLPMAISIACVCISTGWLLFMCGYLLPLTPAAIVVGISSYLVYLIKLPSKSMQA
jgi:hypothetical protein